MILLNMKTNYSLLSSLCNIDNIIKKAKEYGYTSIAITDINNMYGVIEFYNKCLDNDIKPVIGMHLKFDDIDVLLYAKNSIGYRNLLKLSTLVRTDKISKESLGKYKEGLICIGSLDIFEDEYKKEDVYSNEVLYINKKDQIYLDYAYSIRDGLKYEDDRERAPKDSYLKKANELDIDWIILNKIEKACNVKIEYTPDLLPKLEDTNEFEHLEGLCKRGLTKRMDGKVTKKYVGRLTYELSIIKEMGFCGYFLVVWDFIKYAKKNGVLVGPARGSAGGSLVSYCLGITDIDPIEHNLIFERFLNPERITMPDIDIDFPSDKRDMVIEYVTNKHGSDKVAQIITFGTMKARAVIRDVGRCMDIPIKLVDRVCKTIDPRIKLIQSYKTNERLRKLIDSSSDLKRMYEVSLHLEGMPRHTSIHAAGIIISNKKLDDVIPLDKGIGNTLTTQYSMEYLESLGLLKMDFLGLANLTTIQNILDNLKRDGIEIDYHNIPLDDKEALKVFYEVNTVGIFQFESTGMRRFLEKLNITSFEHVVAAIALYRPGPMENIDLYIRRKDGKEKIDYIHPDLKEVLEDTYGIIVYQEQIMRTANILAGYSLGEADVLRRAMSKKKIDVMEKGRVSFIERSIERGYTKEIAEKVYALILKFAGYGFNRAHSVAYSVIAYNLAYFKAHYPSYFITNLLNSVIGNESKTKEYIDEAKRSSIIILKPEINKSYYSSIGNKEGIILGFGIIKGVGSAAVSKIVEERKKGKFKSFFDFVARVYGKAVSKDVVESLINAGCFSEFKCNLNTLHNNLDSALNYADLAGGGDTLFSVEEPIMDRYPEFDSAELMQRELTSLGFYASNHPISKYKNVKNVLPLSDIESNLGKIINIICYVEKKREISTKKGDKMAFFNVGDEKTNSEIVLFPLVYKEYMDIKKGDIILVKAKVEKRLSNYQLIGEKFKILTDVK